jgi:hypothetical protein
MKQKLTQINPSPTVAGDGKLPELLLSTDAPLYSRVMDAIDRQEEGLRTHNRKVILEAHAAIVGTRRLIAAELCYEYSAMPAKRDNPNCWDVLCFSGNLGRPLQHAFCADCVFFNTSNNPAYKRNTDFPPYQHQSRQAFSDRL